MVPGAPSFRSYGKIDPYTQFEYETKKKARRRVIIMASASVFLVAAIVGISVGVALRSRSMSSSDTSTLPDSTQYSSGSAAIKAACNTTLYPDTCTQSLSQYPGALTADPLHLVIMAVDIALLKTSEALNLSVSLAQQSNISDIERATLEDCGEMLANSIDQLKTSINQLSSLDVRSLQSSLQEIGILISTASSEHTACSDGFENITSSSAFTMLSKQNSVNEFIMNAISLVETLASLGSDLSSWNSATADKVSDVFNSFRRHLLMHPDTIPADGGDGTGVQIRAPEWAERMLAQVNTTVVPNMVVSKDGKGNFTRLKDALNKVPTGYKGRYVIYIKAGIYNEGPLNISSDLVNLTLIGDGCNKTIITGSASVALSNTTTYRSATVGVAAKGFLARKITFRNTAGPKGHQAVAMRSNAENFVFDQCCCSGYQATQSKLSGKQFFRGCKILGTVDFIFGNALAVFQNCDLVARQAALGQQNTYTAQGRKEKVLLTGYSFQNCSLIPGKDLAASKYNVTTYLGRPWKDYSTTVFLQSFMDKHISPDGWLSWNTSYPFQNTCYYAEYKNRGPGSPTSGRVKWKCVHPAITTTDATKFTIAKLFPDTRFIPSDVPQIRGLI